MEGPEIIVEAHKEALHKINILGRNNHAEGIGAEHENKHGDQSSAENGLGIVDGRVLYIAHMYARHLHAGIEKEYRCRQNNVVEVGKVGEEVAMEIHLRVASGSKINHSAYHQYAGRDDGAYHTTDFRYLAYPSQAFH